MCDYGGETFGERAEAAVEVVGVRGNRNGCDDEFAVLHGAEYEVGATGIERDDDAIVVIVHRSGIGLIRLCDRTPGCRCAPVASRLSGSAGRRRGCGARAVRSSEEEGCAVVGTSGYVSRCLPTKIGKKTESRHLFAGCRRLFSSSQGFVCGAGGHADVRRPLPEVPGRHCRRCPEGLSCGRTCFGDRAVRRCAAGSGAAPSGCAEAGCGADGSVPQARKGARTE